MSDLVKIARTYVPFQTTHFYGCEREHIECLVQRMADEIERLTAERDEAWAERDALRIELDVCRSAIEDCYDIVETFDCYNDSDDACQRATLRRLNEAIGKAAPRLLHERPDGQKLYGLRYRELMAERDALAKDAERYQFLRAHRTLELNDNGTLGIEFVCDFDHYDDLDAAIDAQIEQEKANGSR